MRLTKLELHGFKSFADATEFVFDDGVTAIVGPNGCGKSNVSDAVRWVLGEQRVRLLRGAKMEEVIFQGSSSRRPVNLAQVSLYFDNADGAFPVPFSEVVISRRLARSGESEYLLNNTPCRLRDIHDMMRGTGLGADAGVVIEARMIDALLSDRPDERRELFEEAAGVSLYRDRRRTTERRLEETSHDLHRLDDVLAEKTTLVRSLARQRKRAERHAELMQRRLALELTLAAHEVAEWADRIDALERELTARRAGAPAVREKLAQLEAARDAAHRAREAADMERGAAARRLADERDAMAAIEKQIAVAEADQRSAIERYRRADAERHLERLEAERVAGLLAAAERDRIAADEAVASAAATLAAREAAEAEARAALAAARAGADAAEHAVRASREREHTLQLDRDAALREQKDIGARLTQLAAELPPLLTSLESIAAHVSAAEAEAAAARAAAAAASAALASARDEAAAARDAEAAARDGLQKADETHTAVCGRANALEQLERERVGLAPAAAKLMEERARFGDGAIIGPISDFVGARSDTAALVERYLGVTLHAVVVRDGTVAEAVRIWHRDTRPGPLLLLPLDANPRPSTSPGDLSGRVRADAPVRAWVEALLGNVRTIDDGLAFRDARGAVWLPGESLAAGPLQRRAELDELRARAAAAAAARDSAAATAAEAVAARLRADAAVRDAQAKLEHAAQARHESEARLAEARSRLEHVHRTIDEIESRRARLEERRAALAVQLREIDIALEESAARFAKGSQVADDAQAALVAAHHDLETARDARTRAAVAHAEAAAQRQVLAEREARLRAEESAHTERLEALSRELEAATSTGERLASQLAESQLALEARRTNVQHVERELGEAEERLRAASQELVAAEHALDEARREATTSGDALHAAELEHRDLTAKRSLIRERLEAEWRRPLDELYAGHVPVEGDPDILRAEAEDVRGQLDALGLVNPLAVEEHREEMQRLEFLQRQRADLADAQRSLQQAIREIDATARELFLKTFAHVRDNFRHTFFTLFGGGECDLRLTDPEAPLDCDIEIHAAPRGKRTQRIHLLSSGERALVALSLLFGIFLTKPSPFCLLDEVDAPLDDANIGRYVRMLAEFKRRTQFIVITHNPRTTTEAADVVYGVTMQEPGVSSVVAVRMRGSAIDDPSVESPAA